VSALVLALTGTDHHPFDRMVRWIDEAATRHRDVHFVVQHGVTRPPRVAEGHDFLGHAVLAEMLGRATVVVCHGGPGTITDAREAGHVPLCIPRDPRLGEHVDDHQQRFAKLVGGVGVVREITSVDDFNAELAAALLLAPVPGTPVAASPARDAARALAAAELDAVMAAARPHLLGRRRAHQ
jgi:UDP-N-acetylglucosamine transferase subunit ALG13